MRTFRNRHHIPWGTVTPQTLKCNPKEIIIPQPRNGYMIVLLPLVLTVREIRYWIPNSKILTPKQRGKSRFEAPIKMNTFVSQNLEANRCSQIIKSWLYNEWKLRCLEVRQINSSLLTNLPALISYTKNISQSGLKAENEICRKIKDSWAKIVNIKPENGA